MAENTGDEVNDIANYVRQLSLDKAKPIDEIQHDPQGKLVTADTVDEVPRPLHRDSLYPNGRYAIHVTELLVEDENLKPTMTHLTGEIAPNVDYDGVLAEQGAVGTFFSTSLLGWRNPPCLPDISPYPIKGIPGRKYWRANIPLDNFKEFQFSYVSRHKKQLLLILTKGEAETKHFHSLRGKEAPDIIALNKEDNEYLVYFENKWYVNLYDYEHGLYFVGFFVPGDRFALSEDVVWDTVVCQPY